MIMDHMYGLVRGIWVFIRNHFRSEHSFVPPARTFLHMILLLQVYR